MSLTRQLTRKRNARTMMLDLLLFGGLNAPNEECFEERRKLIARFRKLMVTFKANKPGKLYQYLRDARDANPERTAGSHLDIIDDIDALRDVERELRPRKGNGAL